MCAANEYTEVVKSTGALTRVGCLNARLDLGHGGHDQVIVPINVVRSRPASGSGLESGETGKPLKSSRPNRPVSLIVIESPSKTVPTGGGAKGFDGERPEPAR